MIVSIPEIFLVRQLLSSHNELAFKGLYNLHTKAIYRLAMQLTAGNQLISEDLVCKTWSVAVNNLSGHSGTYALSTELRSILIKCSLDHYHHCGSYMLIHGDFDERLSAPALHRQNMKADLDLEQALGLLPTGYRHVFVLHQIIGYTHVEISELLQISVWNSRSLLFNARKVLLRVLDSALLPQVNPTKLFQETEMGIFKSAYRNISFPNGLREKVIKHLNEKGQVISTYPRTSFVKFISQGLAGRMF
jgi:RNA polymerase sigma-70 factor (ECF subfamily)